MEDAEKFYINYTFSDEKVDDNGELTYDRVIELLNAFYTYKVNAKKL